MANTGGTAEILDMNEARARLRAATLSIAEFPHVGGFLAAMREAAGFSIDDISERTHIRKEFLEAIEMMRLEALPSRPFAIGFVKTYAEELGIDAGAAVARFKENIGVAAPQPAAALEVHEPAQEDVDPRDRSHLSLIAVILVLGFILWCALAISRPAAPTAPLKLTNPPATAAPVRPAIPVRPAAGAPATDAPTIVEAELAEPIAPVYPRRCEAKAAETERVEIAFNVTASGAVVGVRVADSTNACFNEAAINTARLWRFKPRLVDGAPSPAFDLRRTFEFRKPE